MSDDLLKTCKEILTGKPLVSARCPQCNSEGCGPYRCRFSGVSHEHYKVEKYAEEMLRRDLENPKWLRDLKTGAGNG